MKLIAAVLGTITLGARPSLAEPNAPERYWDPGNPTTSPVKGEVGSHGSNSDADGVYGRFEAPFELGLRAGADVSGDGPAGAAQVSLHCYSMAGVYAGYADAFGSDALAGSRIVSFGVDARPAFIPRWSKNWEQGSSFLDLTIDSISLGLGGYFRTPHDGSFGEHRGLELSLGFGIPLVSHAAGPWLGARGVLRWDDPGGTSASAAASALLTLGWHFLVGG